jgi:L-seryl-tRNA(Ser) seleniumtransferase
VPTTLVAVTVGSPDALLAALRQQEPPVIARAGDGLVLFDPRTLADDEVPLVSHAVDRARAAGAI